MLNFKRWMKKPTQPETKPSSGLGKVPNVDVNGVKLFDAMKDESFLKAFLKTYQVSGRHKNASEILDGRKMTPMEREDFYDWFRKPK